MGGGGCLIAGVEAGKGKAWVGLSLFLAGGDCRSCLPVGYYGFNHYSGAISRAAPFSQDSAPEKPLGEAEGIFIATVPGGEREGRGGERRDGEWCPR